MTRIVAFVLAVMAASPSFAQSSATGDDIIRASAAALNDGDAVRAAQLADVILTIKPDDLDGLVLRARAALAMGDVVTAKALAKRAFRITNDGALKFSTARLAAIAHAEAGEDSRAQLWLRRARQFAPDPARAEQVAQEFQLLANRNPWTTNLQFSVTPSSNVNGGSSEDTLFSPGIAQLFGNGITNLSVDARDLAGLEIVGGFQSSYRLSAQQTSATFLNFGANFRAVALQPGVVDAENDKERARVEAAAAAAAIRRDALLAQAAELPEGDERADLELDALIANAIANRVYTDQDVTGRDFSSASISGGVVHQRILQDGWNPTTFRLDLNRTWSAGEPLSWQYSPSISQSVTIADNMALNFQLAQTERQVFETDSRDRHDVSSTSGRAGLTYLLENKDRLSVLLDFAESSSTNANSDFSERGIFVDYAIAQPVAGMQFGFGLGYSERDFGFDNIVALDRTDDIITLNARTRFTNIEYYGFQPEISVNANRTNSVNPRFDTDTVRIGFDLRSSF